MPWVHGLASHVVHPTCNPFDCMLARQGHNGIIKKSWTSQHALFHGGDFDLSGSPKFTQSMIWMHIQGREVRAFEQDSLKKSATCP